MVGKLVFSGAGDPRPLYFIGGGIFDKQMKQVRFQEEDTVHFAGDSYEIQWNPTGMRWEAVLVKND